MKSAAPPTVPLVVPAGGPNWAAVARGIGTVARACAGSHRTRTRRSPRAAFTLHDFPTNRQDRAGWQDQAA